MNMNLKKTQHQGFTLIELLVVISTISLLATSVIASIVQARIKGNNIRRTAEIRNVVNALALAYEDYRSFPCSNIVFSEGPTEAQYNQIMQWFVNKGYLSSIPKDPVNNSSRKLIYDYFTMKRSAGDSCGQIAFLGIYGEGADIYCPSYGKRITVSTMPHCHVFYSEPPPSPPCYPYLEDDGWPPATIGGGTACGDLIDTVMQIPP
ncbi:hypothetical protein A3D60_01660 [Candidatus Uhrbacteria bacterium RIFCSPHIGHO2_02_FULL_47_29]|nr:MAG: hypothetical protein A3D60_01660 [Candidatus Uhrbacteria bacterium RIFCSPHIGHO2_02_FULL_47_29]